MTSGTFDLIPVASVIVDRDARQRRELTGIEELAESIKRNGLINPIVVTRDLLLVAGERRLTAHKLLGFDVIAAQYAEDLDEKELQILELEENIRRVDLSWQDLVRSVAKFDQLKREEDPKWTAEQTADELNMSRANVARYDMVNKFLEEGVKEVCEADKLSKAVNFAQRAMERRKTSTMRELLPKVQLPPAADNSALTITDSDIPAPPPVQRYADILHKDFTRWAERVQEHPFNLVHCDFPYGVNAGDTKGQSDEAGYGYYEDKPEVYFKLIEKFLEKQNNFIAPSAHLVFWFSMDFYHETISMFKAGGWVVNPFPLIWFKAEPGQIGSGVGILPDANRGPRRVYETALLMTRGDRKVVRAVNNAVSAGVQKKYHKSEKPRKMLEHFLRMLVDETTIFLDPTCGSGNAVAVAEELGAGWSLGLEKNEEFALRARENLGLA